MWLQHEVRINRGLHTVTNRAALQASDVRMTAYDDVTILLPAAFGAQRIERVFPPFARQIRVVNKYACLPYKRNKTKWCNGMRLGAGELTLWNILVTSVRSGRPIGQSCVSTFSGAAYLEITAPKR